MGRARSGSRTASAARRGRPRALIASGNNQPSPLQASVYVPPSSPTPTVPSIRATVLEREALTQASLLARDMFSAHRIARLIDATAVAFLPLGGRCPIICYDFALQTHSRNGEIVRSLLANQRRRDYAAAAVDSRVLHESWASLFWIVSASSQSERLERILRLAARDARSVAAKRAQAVLPILESKLSVADYKRLKGITKSWPRRAHTADGVWVRKLRRSLTGQERKVYRVLLRSAGRSLHSEDGVYLREVATRHLSSAPTVRDLLEEADKVGNTTFISHYPHFQLTSGYIHTSGRGPAILAAAQTGESVIYLRGVHVLGAAAFNYGMSYAAQAYIDLCRIADLPRDIEWVASRAAPLLEKTDLLLSRELKSGDRDKVVYDSHARARRNSGIQEFHLHPVDLKRLVLMHEDELYIGVPLVADSNITPGQVRETV